MNKLPPSNSPIKTDWVLVINFKLSREGASKPVCFIEASSSSVHSIVSLFSSTIVKAKQAMPLPDVGFWL